MSKSSTSSRYERVGRECVIEADERREPRVVRPAHREPVTQCDVGIGEPIVEQGAEARMPERRIEIADHHGGVVARAAELDRTDRGRASRLRSRRSACGRARPAPEPDRRPTSPSRRACGRSCRRGRPPSPVTSTRSRGRWRRARSARSRHRKLVREFTVAQGALVRRPCTRRTRSRRGRGARRSSATAAMFGLVVRVEQVE